MLYTYGVTVVDSEVITQVKIPRYTEGVIVQHVEQGGAQPPVPGFVGDCYISRAWLHTSLGWIREESIRYKLSYGASGFLSFRRVPFGLEDDAEQVSVTFLKRKYTDPAYNASYLVQVFGFNNPNP